MSNQDSWNHKNVYGEEAREHVAGDVRAAEQHTHRPSAYQRHTAND
jgi:hypothetical protein